MPFRDIGEHKRTAHADILEQQRQAGSVIMRRVAPFVVISGIGLFLALFVPALLLQVSEPGWYVFLVLVAWFVANLAPLPYVARMRSKYVGSLGGMPYSCRVCEVRVPKLELRSHLMSEHPSEFRYVRRSAYVVTGSILGVAAFFFVLVVAWALRFFPSMSGDALLIWLYVALLAWVGVISFWGVFVDPRHKTTTRAAWKATHFGGEPPRR